jgi:hypothetical protein
MFQHTHLPVKGRQRPKVGNPASCLGLPGMEAPDYHYYYFSVASRQVWHSGLKQALAAHVYVFSDCFLTLYSLLRSKPVSHRRNPGSFPGDFR